MADKFCLRWNDFETNISAGFKELRDDKDFFDVTLACEDDQIQAHKLILSACSPFFKSILRRNQHQHPLLFLKGVKFVDLVSVLDFMYHGEVNVAQEELNTFLAVAEELKVKGLTQTNSQDTTTTSRQTRTPPSRKPPDIGRPRCKIRKREPMETNHEDDFIEEVTPVKQEPPNTYPVSTVAHQEYEQEGPGDRYRPGEQEEPGDRYRPGEQEGPGDKYRQREQRPGDKYIQGEQQIYQEQEYPEYEDGYVEGGTYNGSTDVSVNQNDNKAQREALYHRFLVRSDDCWACADCDASYKQKVHLVEHIEGKHLPQVQWVCPHGCGYLGRSRKNIRYHVGQQHWEEQQQLKLDLGDCQFIISK